MVNGSSEGGRQAVLIASLVKPHIDKKVTEIVRLMAARYRAGEFEVDWFMGKVVEISTLLGLLDELDHAHRMGIAALDKEMRNAN